MTPMPMPVPMPYSPGGRKLVDSGHSDSGSDGGISTTKSNIITSTKVIKNPATPLASLPLSPPSTSENYVRYLFSDFHALNNLRADLKCSVVFEEQIISGYEVYIVEQWACERKLNTCITSYTGNPKHKVMVGVLSIPKDHKSWSRDMTTYFGELVKLHARPKDTDLGLIFVTNLSSFPSNLNLVPVPNGDVRKAWNLFNVNETLRRTGCGGRLVLSIGKPSDVGEDKFKQIFKTHDNVPVTFAARELVTLLQIGLFYCDLLPAKYVDGLLCNETIAAIGNWWDKWGTKRYHTRPKELLCPVSVAGIIGFITGIRNRLASIMSSKVPKDPFDAEFFIESLRIFQKHQHLNKTSRIDAATVECLLSLTNKNSNTDFIGMVKSTMKEVSGKQYRGVSDAEIVDLERLILFLQGSRARYLWLGKGHMRTVIKSMAPTATGIPQISLNPSEIATARDIKRAMMRTVVGQKQKIVEDSRYRRITKIKSNRSDDLGDSSATADIDNSLAYDNENGRISQRQKNGSARGSARTHLYGATLIPPPLPYYASSKDEEPSRGRRRLRKYITISPRHSRGPPTTREESKYTDDNKLWDYSDPVSDAELSDEGEDENSLALKCESLRPFGTYCPSDQRAADDIDLTYQMRRRNSEGDLNQDYESSKSQLKRNSSFSTLEDAILDWSLPFDYPNERLAKTYMIADGINRKFTEELVHIHYICLEYQNRSQVLDDYLENDRKLVDQVEKDVQACYAKDSSLKTDLQELEVFSARLQYEALMLDSRMRDLEEAVDNFTGKVSKLEGRMDGVMRCRGFNINSGSLGSGSRLFKYLSSVLHSGMFSAFYRMTDRSSS